MFFYEISAKSGDSVNRLFEGLKDIITKNLDPNENIYSTPYDRYNFFYKYCPGYLTNSFDEQMSGILNASQKDDGFDSNGKK